MTTLPTILQDAADETPYNPDAVFEKIPSAVTRENRHEHVAHERRERAIWVDKQGKKGKEE